METPTLSGMSQPNTAPQGSGHPVQVKAERVLEPEETEDTRKTRVYMIKVHMDPPRLRHSMGPAMICTRSYVYINYGVQFSVFMGLLGM